MKTLEQLLTNMLEELENSINLLTEEIEKSYNNALVNRLFNETGIKASHSMAKDSIFKDALLGQFEHEGYRLPSLIGQLNEAKECFEILSKFKQENNSQDLEKLNTLWLEEIDEYIKNYKKNHPDAHE